MNYILENVEPRRVMHYFEEICSIPHGSYHMEAISDYVVKFAKKHALTFIKDKADNVVIFREASKGAENAAPLMLQGHMDMVLEKRADVDIDMEQEAITLQTDGEYLFADGTTLGGDDGIAVAMMLAILEDETLEHPALECVFTVDEEVGMLGMEALDPAPLKATRMLNLDSEDEGILTVGCAGGAEMHLTLPLEKKERCGKKLTLHVSGLRGGHSGASIQEGQANADIILARLLQKIGKKAEFALISFAGGSKDNAIPRDADAEILIGDGISQKEIQNVIAKFTAQAKAEYRVADPGITIAYEWDEAGVTSAASVSRKDTKKLVRFLLALPNGVIEMDPNVKDLPQTSLNMGVVRLDEDALRVITLVRSSINSQKKFVVEKVKAVAALADAEVEIPSTYPAWEYEAESPFRDLVAELYEKETGKKPQIAIIHGGLECGLLAGKMKGLSCVSIGPDMQAIHTPDEKLSIASTARTWEFVTAILRACAQN